MKMRHTRGFNGPRITAASGATIIGHLTADFDDVEGEVEIATAFDNLPPLTRADILKDWIGLLEREYSATLEEFRKANPHADGCVVP